MNNTKEKLIGNSKAFAEALTHISTLAGINRPILIIGERGTGKELAAERLHYLSTRWDQPLIKVNCAAISESLMDSELFGHEPGAFTGATRTHRGRFERADGGTLFLDELATMSIRLQEKLLRLIEYGEFERVGGKETLQVDVRVVAATNADLLACAANGTFRADLLDRLSFDVVHLPSLRHRLDDIEELAQHFAVKLAAELHWDFFAGFSEAALLTLKQHSWPGNIRELKNVVERSVYRWANPETVVEKIIINPFQNPFQRLDKNQTQIVEKIVDNHSIAANFSSKVLQFEREFLQAALEKYHAHQGRTAEALGLTYHQLRGLMRKHNLNGRRS